MTIQLNQPSQYVHRTQFSRQIFHTVSDGNVHVAFVKGKKLTIHFSLKQRKVLTFAFPVLFVLSPSQLLLVLPPAPWVLIPSKSLLLPGSG